MYSGKKHERQIQLSPIALVAFRKTHGRDPRIMKANVEELRPCAYTWVTILGERKECQVPSIEHEDRRIGHVFML